jgi:hypothetical protein
VLDRNEASPPYSAAIGCVPGVRLLVARVAEPEIRGDVPIAAESSLKVTVPVGVPPEPVTVAVSVMELPSAAGLAEEPSVVAVPSRAVTA